MSKAISVPLKKLPNFKENALPFYATEQSAGVDLSAAIDEAITLKPNERKLVPTGIALALPEGFEAQIRPRSGLALKNGITVLNTPGTIDADYRGEICVILINLSDQPFTIERGTRIAQMIVAPVSQAAFDVVDILPETDRGTGGFGSTGTR